MCDCAEMQYDDRFGRNRKLESKRYLGAYHDCEYVRQRSALIPRAQGIANREVPDAIPSDAPQEAKNRWNGVFMGAMDKLWKEIV